MSELVQELSGHLNNPLSYVSFMMVLGAAPVALMTLTSFIKLSVVFGILRNALGAGGVPSAALSSTLALILSLHIMMPVIEGAKVGFLSEYKGKLSIEAVIAAGKPVEGFLRKHSDMRERLFFSKGAECKTEDCLVGNENLFSLIPAFLLTEVREAMSIGFMIFLPFLIIDLVVANVLVGMGMLMVSPLTISLPLKLLAFVMCDGWFQLSRSLVLSYG